MSAIRDSSRFLLVLSFYAGGYVVAVGFRPELWIELGVLAVGMGMLVLVAYRFREDYAAETDDDADAHIEPGTGSVRSDDEDADR